MDHASYRKGLDAAMKAIPDEHHVAKKYVKQEIANHREEWNKDIDTRLKKIDGTLGKMDKKVTRVNDQTKTGLTKSTIVTTKDVKKKAVAGSGQNPPKPPKPSKYSKQNMNKKQK
jgi:hypothetical protein